MAASYCDRESGGVGGAEKSESATASMYPSEDHGSVVSRMGMTRRISRNGHFTGSGGIMLNSMKSWNVVR